MKERIIFHIDVNNAFLSWSAVYLLKTGYKQDIRTIPSVIGGNEKERKGIVLAKSPVAKKYNIKTAETIYQAKKKCPTLLILPPNFEWYKEKSKELFTYLKKYSPTMEQFSIDECFIDMTGTNYLYSDFEELAYKIKDEIYSKFGYTVNIGIGNNKLCAKMASDFEKPNKVHTLYRNEIESKLWPLNVEDLLMVGKTTSKILNQIGIYKIEQLAKTDDKILKKYFKSQAEYLKNAALGIDNSDVEPYTGKNKSISISETLQYDCRDATKLKDMLLKYSEELCRKMRKKEYYAKTVTIFFKNTKFKTYSYQAKLNNQTNSTKDIYNAAIKLFELNYDEEPIRLIGLRVANLVEKKEEQLNLFDNKNTTAESQMQNTIDKINEKFGKTVVIAASLKNKI